MCDSTPTHAVHGFGIAWDPEWIGPDRLIVRGYRSIAAHGLAASWDIDALIATVDDALETAQWRDLDRESARAAIRRLYDDDLQP